MNTTHHGTTHNNRMQLDFGELKFTSAADAKRDAFKR